MSPQISRRTVLQTAGTLSLAAVVSSMFAQNSWAASVPSAADFAALRTRWVDQITGRTVIQAGDPDFATAITALNNKAAASLAKVNRAAGRTSVFTDLSLANDVHIASTYQRVCSSSPSLGRPPLPQCSGMLPCLQTSKRGWRTRMPLPTTIRK
ncbi:twin-arginine translocation signal domain-containing protein [Arthrobacter sp. Hiyo1]|uniref:twin-arginine translocation signal domain-containing protein n=1 Tax=Arthrobacter sp. Hiyo1 TaxID=1588020 RepID=UPI001C0F0E50|nr:twin-arginine translocation signal domain-containing protein [Arthrobacter sp. Hiyo1]